MVNLDQNGGSRKRFPISIRRKIASVFLSHENEELDLTIKNENTKKIKP